MIGHRTFFQLRQGQALKLHKDFPDVYVLTAADRQIGLLDKMYVPKTFCEGWIIQ